MFHLLGPLGAGPPALPMMQMQPQMGGPQMRPYWKVGDDLSA